jgi:hypothetical protein
MCLFVCVCVCVCVCGVCGVCVCGVCGVSGVCVCGVSGLYLLVCVSAGVCMWSLDVQHVCILLSATAAPQFPRFQASRLPFQVVLSFSGAPVRCSLCAAQPAVKTRHHWSFTFFTSTVTLSSTHFLFPAIDAPDEFPAT